MKKFGDIAREKKFITKEQLKKALDIQEQLTLEGFSHKLLGIIMLEENLLTSAQLVEVLQELEDQQGTKHY